MLELEFFKHLGACAIDWGYFTNFDISLKLKSYRAEINALQRLVSVKEDEINDCLIAIVREYPKSVELLLLMIALRPKKLSEVKIESSIALSFKKEELLNQTINEEELLAFFCESGLKEFFLNEQITHLESYLIGVEVGLDSNARKNRSGALMAKKCEEILNSYCKENGLVGRRESTLKRYGLDLDKQFDYLIEHPQGLIVFEFNLYNSNGSKIKSVSKEYQKLSSILEDLNIIFVWVTSGEAWLQNRGIAMSNLETIKHFINYHQLKNGYMNGVFKI